MAYIHILDHNTIDKIAAGEVVERPASIVKELVENSIDAGATAITVEIRDGGISFIRVSDNGCGIEKTEVEKAFLRHATSKITKASDLHCISSLGFRGEALSSISAVSQVELITKTPQDMVGLRVCLEATNEMETEEVGAPQGTTIVVRNLFFNVPVRKKFLKSAATESGYISDLMEHLLLSNPQIAFQFVVNKQVKYSTPGNGDLKQVIHCVYGKEIADSLMEISYEDVNCKLYGYLGMPSINRATRNMENCFLNNRYIKSTILSKAIEEGYRGFVMQHKYPVCFLLLSVSLDQIDVNVHPTKMDVRFVNPNGIYESVSKAIENRLSKQELITQVVLDKETSDGQEKELIHLPYNSTVSKESSGVSAVKLTTKDFMVDFDELEESYITGSEKEDYQVVEKPLNNSVNEDTLIYGQTKQLELFEEKIISTEKINDFHIIGQIFDTYWLVIFQDKLFMIDQHAAHEKIKYERLRTQLKNEEIFSQNIYPPIVISLTGQEQAILKQYQSQFNNLGFSFDGFGGNEIVLRTAPTELFGNTSKEMFLDILNELSVAGNYKGLSVDDKIASMACKAAVKGNHCLDIAEMKVLLEELVQLDNPYFCPHGRPTMISFTKNEIEKKFKRIVN